MIKTSNSGVVKIFCKICKQYTNHKVISQHDKTFTPHDTPGMQIDFVAGNWQILECLGCEDISFRESWVNSEDQNQISGELYENENIYPHRSPTTLPVKKFFYVPKNLMRIYREVIDCYNNEIYTMCAAGLRAVIEGICAEEEINKGPVEIKKGDGTTKTEQRKNLEGKINGLADKGVLTRQHSEFLHGHRFLGNNAVHDLKLPKTDELKAAIEIVEHTLENLYELEDKADKLRSIGR